MRLSDQHIDISRLLTILGKLVAVRAIEGFPIESQPLVLVKHTNKPRIKNPNYVVIGDIASLRKRKGISANELSKKASISAATLIRIENHEYKTTKKSIAQRIAFAMEVTFEEVCNE